MRSIHCKPAMTGQRTRLFLLAIAWIIGTSSHPVSAAAPDAAAPVTSSRETVTFNTHVRPILSERCFPCHGPDEKRREGGLRLDNFEGATASGAIVPGQPDVSEVLRRILSTDPDEQMPPPAAKKAPLTVDEVQILKSWIQSGALYQGHWAFLPISIPIPPRTESNWVRNPIDEFIVAELQQRELQPSGEADRGTLIRRISLDLTGLLPSPEETRQFVNDPDPTAYEKLVDRLLASPHYGERWGRYWLDQARYADSNGYSIDGPREMWPYRDWVITTLNEDLPFDQFTIEQLAGDLLPAPTKRQLIATGFHRNTLINQEGGTDPEQFRVEAAMDRVNTTGAVWLGLTVGCAQCHTHKYDPLQHDEYYGLMAFFNSGQDTNNTGATVEVVRGEMFGQPVTVEREPPGPSAKEIAVWRSEWEQKRLAELEKAAASQPITFSNWEPLALQAVKSTGTAEFQLMDDQSALVTSPPSSFDSYRITVSTKLPQLSAIRLRVLPDATLPKNGPGRAANGNFVLTSFRAYSQGLPLKFKTAAADHEQSMYPALDALDDNPKSGWAINVTLKSTQRMNAPHEAIFVLEQPWQATGAPLEVELRHDLHADYLIGRFALDGIAENPELPGDLEAQLLAALRLPEKERNPSQKSRLQAEFEAAEPRAKKKPAAPNPDLVQAMVMKDLAKPRETYVLTRGDFTRPDKPRGAILPTVFAEIAPKLTTAPESRNRLDLARWLVDPNHPLTARVTVNRTWMRYFGRGLVETEDDFGTQGAPPTHPELLDWLATEFRRQDWSQKAFHRLIVTSATYRQSSAFRPDLQRADPRNSWLGRQNRLRLDAEAIRDVGLAASGLLHDTLGGPSVYPPQPEGVYAFTQVNKKWPTETGPQRYRRTLYTFFYRSAPYPLLSTFDSPDFQSVCTRRIRSNSPLQALTLANDENFIEFARGLARQAIAQAPGQAEQQLSTWIENMVERAFCRPATSAERVTLVNFARETWTDFAQDLPAAEGLTTPELRSQVPVPVAAALVLTARAILNTDNFIIRE